MSQRKVAGGVIATRLPSRNRIASSRTASVRAHSPAPFSVGTEGAMAKSVVRRMRQADGPSSTCELDSIGSTGRGRGKGTLWAAASLLPAGNGIIREKISCTGWVSGCFAGLGRLAIGWPADPTEHTRSSVSACTIAKVLGRSDWDFRLRCYALSTREPGRRFDQTTDSRSEPSQWKAPLSSSRGTITSEICFASRELSLRRKPILEVLMSQNRYRNLASGGLALCLAAIMGATSQATSAPSYDGLWSVVIVTETGTCDRAYRYPIRISNGTLINAGDEA